MYQTQPLENRDLEPGSVSLFEPQFTLCKMTSELSNLDVWFLNWVPQS